MRQMDVPRSLSCQDEARPITAVAYMLHDPSHVFVMVLVALLDPDNIPRGPRLSQVALLRELSRLHVRVGVLHVVGFVAVKLLKARQT